MKKLVIAGALSLMTVSSLMAKELKLDDVHSDWGGNLRDFKVVDTKGIDGKDALSFKAKSKYKMIHYKEKFNVEEGQKMIASCDFKMDIDSGANNKAFITLLIAPNIFKAEHRMLFSMANGKKGFMAMGQLPRWVNKGVGPKLLGMDANSGESPWLRLEVTVENQGKKIAAKGSLYSLGTDGDDEPKLVMETKLKRKTKKSDWKSSDDWAFALGSNEFHSSNLNELVISKIDVKIKDI